ELHATVVVVRELLDDGGDHAAGTAPRSPEVDQDGGVAVQDVSLEGRVRGVGGVSHAGVLPSRHRRRDAPVSSVWPACRDCPEEPSAAERIIRSLTSDRSDGYHPIYPYRVCQPAPAPQPRRAAGTRGVPWPTPTNS